MTGTVGRDEDGMPRVERSDVVLRVGCPEADWRKAEGCFGNFEKDCIVPASVARGIPIDTRLRLSAP